MYIHNFMHATARTSFTIQPEDFPPHKSSLGNMHCFIIIIRQVLTKQTGIYIFWRPHLEQLVDLNHGRRKMDAGRLLVPFIQRLLIRKICTRVAAKARAYQANKVFYMHLNEIKRTSEKGKIEQEYVEPLDKYENMRHRDLFLNFTDILPEPWETIETSNYNRVLKKNFLMR